MARLILSEEEKNRIKNQYKDLSENNGALKWGHNVLFEQDDTETKYEVGDVVDGQVFKGYKTKKVKKTYNEKGMYVVGKSDPSKFLTTFVDGIEATIKADPVMAESLVNGTLQLAIANIRSGASNHYNEPLMPEVSNKYQPNPKLRYYKQGYEGVPTVEQLKEKGNSNWDANKKLAQTRSTVFLQKLKEALIERGIKIFPAIEETVDSKIVDTGGMIDEKCVDNAECAKRRPNPGQFVDASLAFAYEQTEGIWENFEECVGGMKVTAGYYATPALIKKTAEERGGSGWSYLWNRVKQNDVVQFNQGRASTEWHECNRAKFEFFFNGQSIGVVNLNNKSDGLSREGTLTIGSETLKAIVAASTEFTAGRDDLEEGEVMLQIKGLHGDPHSEVPYMTIVNGRGETIMKAEASTVATYKDATDYTSQVDLFSFNPCETIT